MARFSIVDRLPAAHRDLIGRLRRDGRTIDEILAELRMREVPLSRSALGRYLRRLEAGSEGGFGAELLAIRSDINRIGRDLAALRRLIVPGADRRRD